MWAPRLLCSECLPPRSTISAPQEHPWDSFTVCFATSYRLPGAGARQEDGCRHD